MSSFIAHTSTILFAVLVSCGQSFEEKKSEMELQDRQRYLSDSVEQGHGHMNNAIDSAAIRKAMTNGR
jgi:hypothetical protein